MTEKVIVPPRTTDEIDLGRQRNWFAETGDTLNTVKSDLDTLETNFDSWTNSRSSATIGLSANHSIGSATHTVVRFDSVLHDVNSDYDATNYRFVASSAGIYLILTQTTYSVVASGDRIRTHIRINGTNVTWTDNVVSSGVYHNLFSSIIYSLSASDYIDVTAFNNNGTGDNVVGSAEKTQTYLSVQKMQND